MLAAAMTAACASTPSYRIETDISRVAVVVTDGNRAWIVDEKGVWIAYAASVELAERIVTLLNAYRLADEQRSITYGSVEDGGVSPRSCKCGCGGTCR